MRCLYITTDLFFSSRVCSLARDQNISVEVVSSFEIAAERLPDDDIKLALLDLTPLGANVAQSVTQLKQIQPDLRIIAYGPHVDDELLTAARQAGCDEVMPRSQFDQEILPILRRRMLDRS
jgi:DNA-binding NarL/FixJ family response regulator